MMSDKAFNATKNRRMKRDKAETCRAMEVGGKLFETFNDFVDSVPIIGAIFGTFTAGMKVASHLAKGGLDIAQTAIDCGDVPFEEIRNIMEKRFNAIDRKLDEHTAVLKEIRNIASKTRVEMHQRFDELLLSVETAKVNPIISQITNFVRKFNSISDEIDGLKTNEYVDRLTDDSNNVLNDLRKHSTPEGLLGALFDIIDQGYAIPSEKIQATAFRSLYALVIGTQTYIEIMFFLNEQYSYLANYYYQKSYIDEYRKYFYDLNNCFNEFKSSLIGSISTKNSEPLLQKVIQILKWVISLDFVWIHKTQRLMLNDMIQSFEKVRDKIAGTVLPVLEKEPQNYVHIIFEKNIPSSLGAWSQGGFVSYAVQYQSNASYAKVSQWSEEIQIQNRACPTLKFPGDPLRKDRLLFRKINDQNPQLVGIIKADQSDFVDLSRDFYNAADLPDKDEALKQAEILYNAEDSLVFNSHINNMFERAKTALHAAAKRGHAEIANRFILGKPFVNINKRDADGYSPLHIAADSGQDEFVKLLINRKADVNIKSYPYLYTPLHIAVRHGFNSTVQVLLENSKVNASATDISGFTPIHNAVLGGIHMIDILTSKRNIDINAKSKRGLTPFHLAIINDDLDVAKHLIKHGNVEIKAKDEKGMTPLHHAAMMGHVDMLKYLLTLEGIDINAVSEDGWTPLHFSILFKRDDFSKILLAQKNINIRLITHNYLSPLHFAVIYGRKDIVVDLLQLANKKQDRVIVNHQGWRGFTPLHFAAMRESPDILRLLLNDAANVNAKSFDTSKISTPLHEAALPGREDNIISLLDHRANIEAKDIIGDTPLHRAAANGAIKEAKILLNSKPNLLNATNNLNETPLFIASKRLKSDAVRYFAELGANINVQNNSEISPLDIYAEAGQLEMVQYLIKKGADMYHTNKWHYNYLYYAIKNGHLDIVKDAVEKQQFDFNKAKDRLISSGCPDDCFWPLCDATDYNHVDILKYILSKDKWLMNHCVLLKEAITYGHLGIVKYFIQERNGNIENGKIPGVENNTDYNGNSLLCFAVLQRRWEVAKYLLQKGANSKVRCYQKYEERKEDILICSIHQEGLEIAKMLIKKGADANIRDSSGRSLLHIAVENQALNIVKYLVEEIKIPVNDVSTGGNKETPLHIAADNESVDIVEYLVSNGADLKAKDKNGDTPYDIAAKSYYPEVANYLKSQQHRYYRSIPRNIAKNNHDDNYRLNYLQFADNGIGQPFKKSNVMEGNGIRSFTVGGGSSQTLPFSKPKNVDITGFLFLVDVFIRKFTKQKFINNDSNDIDESNALIEALQITDKLQNFFNGRNSFDEKIDLLEIFSNLKKSLTSGNANKVLQILCSTMKVNMKKENIEDLLNPYAWKKSDTLPNLSFSSMNHKKLISYLSHSIDQNCFSSERNLKMLHA